MPWPTATEVEQRTRITLTAGVTSYGLDVTELIAKAKAYAESYCGREFDEEATTETHDGGELVIVQRPPIVSVSSITVDGTALDTDEYWVYTNYVRISEYQNGAIRIASYYAPELRNVVIAYTGGYSDAVGGIPIPAELSEVILEIACRWLMRADDHYRTAKGVKQLSVGNVAVTYAQDREALADLLTRLDRFRMVTV